MYVVHLSSTSVHFQAQIKEIGQLVESSFFYKNNIYIATIFAIFSIFSKILSLRFPHQIQRFRHIFLARFSVLPFLFNNIPLPEKMNYQCDQGMLTALNLLED